MTEELQFLFQLEFFVIIFASVCFLSFYVFWVTRRKTKFLQEKLERLERELKVANSSAIGMGQQLIALEKQISQQLLSQPPQAVKSKSLSTLKNKVSNQPDLSNNRLVSKSQQVSQADNRSLTSYDEARQALALGKSIEEVSKDCRLSYAEVSLLQALSKESIISR